MPVISGAQSGPARWPEALVILASLLLVLSLLAAGLLVYAIQRHAVELPPFSVRLGHIEFSGPCPPAFQCDVHQPYYAIWRGDDQPDGSIKFHELYFVWLPKKH